MTGKSNHSWRELIYLGQGWAQDLFAAESDSARLNGRGGMGYVCNISLEDPGPNNVHCNCPGFAIQKSCWHVVEAPKAQFYWSIRLAHGKKSREEFDAFYQQWWPKHDPIMQRCRKEGEFKGRSEEQWTLFYAATLDEWNARTAAHGKLDRTFGKDFVSAMLNPPKEAE